MLNSKTLLALAITGFALCSAPMMVGCSTTQPAGVQMSDANITSKVKAKYIGDSDVKSLDISVTTEEGVVYLTGRVETQAQKEEAERIAKGTDGVRSVVNHLVVGDRT